MLTGVASPHPSNKKYYSMACFFGKNRLFPAPHGLVICCLCVLCSILLQPKCIGQVAEKKIQEDQIAFLVSRLGSPEFAARESAMELLSQSDEKRLPELELALKKLTDEDLEARIRLSGIIAKIKNDRTLNQIRTFLRSTDQTQTMGFDGWKSFARVCGVNRNAKMLFLKLLEAYPELVFAELNSKQEALVKARDIAATINEKLTNLTGYEVPDALAMLYCLNIADDMTDRTLEKLSVRTFSTSPFSQQMSDPQFKKSLERLMLGWSKRIEERLPQCLMLFIEKDYPQAKDIALRILELPEIKTETIAFVRSMQAVYRFGTAADLPQVEKWLDDKTICVQVQDQAFGNPLTPQAQETAEFRDIALLVSMHLAGEDYSSTFPQIQPTLLWGFREDSVLLPANSDEVRTKRIENWRAKRQGVKL